MKKGRKKDEKMNAVDMRLAALMVGLSGIALWINYVFEHGYIVIIRIGG